jgi:hypothetical protein
MAQASSTNRSRAWYGTSCQPRSPPIAGGGSGRECAGAWLETIEPAHVSSWGRHDPPGDDRGGVMTGKQTVGAKAHFSGNVQPVDAIVCRVAPMPWRSQLCKHTSDLDQFPDMKSSV